MNIIGSKSAVTICNQHVYSRFPNNNIHLLPFSEGVRGPTIFTHTYIKPSNSQKATQHVNIHCEHMNTVRNMLRYSLFPIFCTSQWMDVYKFPKYCFCDKIVQQFLPMQKRTVAGDLIASTQLLLKACCWATGSLERKERRERRKTSSLPWHIVNLWYWGWSFVNSVRKVGGVGRALPLGTLMGGVGRHWRITEGSARIRVARLNREKKDKEVFWRKLKNTEKELMGGEEMEGKISWT